MASWQNRNQQNGKMKKWQAVGIMIYWQNGKLMKCQINKMESDIEASWHNALFTKGQIDKMSSRQNGKWHSGKLI